VQGANLKPVRYELSNVRGYPGFAAFNGRVVVYNFTTGWYDPVPNALVEATLVTSTYKLNKIFMRTDEQGLFVLHGVPSSGAAAGGGTAVPFSRWVFRGWVLDDKGTILMATDLGQFGMQNFPQIVIVLHGSENVTVAVSKAVSLEILDMEMPNMLTTPSLEVTDFYPNGLRHEYEKHTNKLRVLLQRMGTSCSSLGAAQPKVYCSWIHGCCSRSGRSSLHFTYKLNLEQY
ncbi:MAG: hypothetical protein QXF26_07815, partial [Candidatus Bathyarchaeia archaeon]